VYSTAQHNSREEHIRFLRKDPPIMNVQRKLRTRLAAAVAVAGLAAAGLGASAVSPASAQTTPQPIADRLAKWYTPDKIGLMVHWGMNTGKAYTTDAAMYPPLYQTPAEFESAAAGWSPDTWVNDAVKLHAGYITVASFHSQLGYIRPWHSAPTTSRDYIGELVTAAHAKGIKVVTYIAPDLDHNRNSSLNDTAGYLAYKKAQYPNLTPAQLDSSFNINNTFGFGAFTFDAVQELYQKDHVDGFWFDSHNNPTWYPANSYPYAGAGSYPYSDDPNRAYDAATFTSSYSGPRDMVQFVHNLNPDLVTSVNNFPPIIPADVVSSEPGNAGFDYTAPLPRATENLLTAVGNDWWYYGGNPAVTDYPGRIKQVVQSLGTGVNAVFAEGPTITGQMPSGVEDYNTAFNTFLGWAGPSLLSPAIAGGHGQGGLPGGSWSDHAAGVTTLVPGTNTQYIHVLTKPGGNTVIIPNTRYNVTSAVNLKTGAALNFTTTGGNLAITVPVSDWSSLGTDGDYVIKLNATDQAPGTTTVDDSDPAITYTGSFSSFNPGGCYNGTCHNADTAGSTAAYQFTGTGITWNGITGPDQGSASVSIDGGSPTTVTLTAPTRSIDTPVYTSPTLTAGTHTIKITTQSSAWVTVDRFTTTATAAARTGPITGIAGLCVDVRQAQTGDGTPVQTYTCNGTNAQSWTVSPDGTLRSLGKCMDITGGNVTSGTKIQLYTCNGTAAQTWEYQAGGALLNRASGLCLDVPQASPSPGTQLQIYTCNHTNAQSWTLPS
jgi:hypothetical protein